MAAANIVLSLKTQTSRMAVIFYKFKSDKNFHAIPIDAPFISVSDFKSEIFASKRYGHGKDFDLIITDAGTDQLYDDGSVLIPASSSLLIRRIAGIPRLPIVVGEKPKIEENPSSVVVVNDPREKDGFDSHDFGPDFNSVPKRLTVNPINTHCNEDKIDHRREDKIDGGFKCFYPVRGFGKGHTPPQGYVCHRCKVAGHYIQHCPTNGDPNFDFQRVKPATANPKASASSCCSSVGDNMIPPELYCPLCKKVMRDAALTKCCFSSFCDKCIRDHIVSKSAACVCQRKIVADDVLPNMTLRDTISRILSQSGDKNSVNGGTSAFSVQDAGSAASKADQPTKIVVPPLQTSDSVKEPTSKEEQQKKAISGETEEKRKRKRKVSTMQKNSQPKTSQDDGVNSYMMPLHYSAYNPYMAGGYPGFMWPYPQNQMFTAFPPEKNAFEFGMDANFAQPMKKLRV